MFNNKYIQQKWTEGETIVRSWWLNRFQGDGTYVEFSRSAIIDNTVFS